MTRPWTLTQALDLVRYRFERAVRPWFCSLEDTDIVAGSKGRFDPELYAQTMAIAVDMFRRKLSQGDQVNRL